MTPRQIELVRHALGLTRQKQSYRRHFVASKGHTDFQDWQRLVKSGDACLRNNGMLHEDDSFFLVTRQGAEKVLKKGESLCPEHFPQKAA